MIDGSVSIAEHLYYLLKDEEYLFVKYSLQQRGSSDISKMRKYLIEFIFQIGDRLKQRTLTLQIAI